MNFYKFLLKEDLIKKYGWDYVIQHKVKEKEAKKISIKTLTKLLKNINGDYYIELKNGKIIDKLTLYKAIINYFINILNSIYKGTGIDFYETVQIGGTSSKNSGINAIVSMEPRVAYFQLDNKNPKFIHFRTYRLFDTGIKFDLTKSKSSLVKEIKNKLGNDPLAWKFWNNKKK